MGKTRLERYPDQGAPRKRDVPVFKSTDGVETLFYVFDEFDKAATRIGLAVGNKWTQFKDIPDSVALTKWKNQIRAIAANQRTANRFKAERKKFVNHFLGHPTPRDVLIEYIRNNKDCQKPRSATCGDHANRIEALCRFANRLTGDEAELNDTQIRKYVFDSFPDLWRKEYHANRFDLETDGIPGIVKHMDNMKLRYDDQEHKAKKRRTDDDDTPRLRGGGQKNGGRGKGRGNGGGNSKNNKKRGVDDDDKCPIHTNGNHKWGECTLNPRSDNYTARTNGHNQGGHGYYGNQGRGGGRGGYNGGRGFGQGRGQYGGRGGRGDNGGRGNYGEQHYNQQPYTQDEGPPDVPQEGTPLEHHHFQMEPHGSGWRYGNRYGRRGPHYPPSYHYHGHGR